MQGIPNSIFTGRALVELARVTECDIEIKFRNSRRVKGEQYAEECTEFTLTPKNNAEPVVFWLAVNTLYKKVLIKCDTLKEHTERRIYGFSRVIHLGLRPHTLAEYTPTIRVLLEEVALVQSDPRGTFPIEVPPYTRAVWNEAQFELILQEARAHRIVAALEDTEIRGSSPNTKLYVYIRTTASGHYQLLEAFRRLEARNKDYTLRAAHNIAENLKNTNEQNEEEDPKPTREFLEMAAKKLGAPLEELLVFGWFHTFPSTSGPRGGLAGCMMTAFPVFGVKWTDKEGRIHAVKACAGVWRSWDGNTGGW